MVHPNYLNISISDTFTKFFRQLVINAWHPVLGRVLIMCEDNYMDLVVTDITITKPCAPSYVLCAIHHPPLKGTR